MWFGQLRLLFAFTRGGQEYNAAFIRWYEAVPNGHQRTGRARQAGLWLPATPFGCSASSGLKSGWAARAAIGTAASSSHPSCGRPSSSLTPPVQSTTSTTTSCADAPVSSLHCLPLSLRCLAECSGGQHAAFSCGVPVALSELHVWQLQFISGPAVELSWQRKD